MFVQAISFAVFVEKTVFIFKFSFLAAFKMFVFVARYQLG